MNSRQLYEVFTARVEESRRASIEMSKAIDSLIDSLSSNNSGKIIAFGVPNMRNEKRKNTQTLRYNMKGELLL